MGWLRTVDSLKLQVSFAKEPYKRDDILQKRPIILRSPLIVATPYLVAISNWHDIPNTTTFQPEALSLSPAVCAYPLTTDNGLDTTVSRTWNHRDKTRSPKNGVGRVFFHDLIRQTHALIHTYCILRAKCPI